jgi:hypothetical protein
MIIFEEVNTHRAAIYQLPYELIELPFVSCCVNYMSYPSVCSVDQLIG